jgi:hypothetical protein
LAQVPSSADDNGKFIFGGNVKRYHTTVAGNWTLPLPVKKVLKYVIDLKLTKIQVSVLLFLF